LHNVCSGRPLGKERRWLSHYDILDSEALDTKSSTPIRDDINASQARLDVALQNADAILEAAKSNTRFLSEVEKMSLADGMLGSGKQSGLGGIDDTLEELRWYVYQQECADALRDGLNEVPFTNDKNSLLGGVLREGEADDEEVVDMELESAEPFNEEKSVVPVLVPSLLSFQEGDHVGEAPYDEIKAGFEDGELSNSCVVFHHASDEWLPIEDFIQQYEDGTFEKSANCRKRDLTTMKEVNGAQDGESSESKAFETIHSTNIDSISNECNTPACLTPAAEKREKKKPQRDISQWGQCSAPHINLDTIQDNSTQDEKKSDCHDIEMDDSSSMPNQSKKSKKNKQTKPPPKMMRFITQVS
jgi:hypothetical protein